MHTITISLSDEDFDALEREAARAMLAVEDRAENAVRVLAREIRAREAIALSDEPCEWKRP